MGLFDILKAAMGLGSSRSQSTSGTTDVTVEHEPDTESEDAVKGTNGADTDTESTESTVETDATEADAGAETDGADADTSETDSADADAADAGADEAPDVEGADEPVDTINGIGPSYAERLGEGGVETVGDLVASDPAELAEATDISEKRIQGWIDKASE